MLPPPPARGPRRPSADLCTLVKWGPALPPPLPRFLQSVTRRFGAPVPLPSPAPSPLCVLLFFKNLFPNLYGMANCWGGRFGEGGFAWKTHTLTTPHAHAAPARASGGRGRRARRTPPLPAGNSVPSRDEGGDRELEAAPPLPDCASVGARRPAISSVWRGGFCPRHPLGSGWQVGRERAEGSFWRLPKKGGKRRTSSHRRQEIRHPNTRCKDANPQATHPHTHPHTHTQFYLPLVVKMKLPSDTRSALRVSVQFNDD